MEIIVADKAGFCSGVKKAVDLALNLENKEGQKYSLGPLIHNRFVVKELEEKGILPVDDLEEIKTGSVIIRSHGASPDVFEKLKKANLNVVDATCPFVKKAQKIVSELYNDNYDIVIVGDHGHPEVEALVGWSNKKAHVVQNLDEALNLKLNNKVAVVSQTTQPEENFQEIVEGLKNKGLQVKVYNTICNATHQRQQKAKALAREVDVMVVIGGYNSANTCKLAQICSKECTTYHIEDATDLKKEWFVGVKKAGVTAGASTPDRIIREVVEKMVELNNEMENKEIENSAGEEQSLDTQEILEDIKPFERGDIIKGKVVQINENEVLVDVGAKADGIVPLSELSIRRVEDPNTVVAIGDEIDLQVIKAENEEGHPILSKRRADRKLAWDKLEKDFAEGNPIEGKAVEVVKGGILVDVGLRGFIPASLLDRGYVENLEEFIGKDLKLKIIELDKSKNKIVLSRKAILDEEYEKKRQETWETLKEGEVRKGIVRRLTDFGAFIDIGAVDGLLHVSEISWGRVEHPSDVLSEGQELDVKVLSVDRDNERVSLGLKQLTENPWNKAAEKYPVGSLVEGKVLRIAPFGAFVEVEPGVEGLIHISQLAEEHVEKTEDVVSVGDEVKVRVLSVDSERQRMSLSLKDAKEKATPKAEKKKEVRQPVKYEDDLPESGVKLGDLFGDLLKKANEK